MPNYFPKDFYKPKVVGLAIDNAKKAENRARLDWEDNKSVGFVPLEVCAYCLFLVRPDCTVEAIGAAPTTADFAPLVRRANIDLLAKKYGAIGFVTKRTPKTKAEWGIISL